MHAQLWVYCIALVISAHKHLSYVSDPHGRLCPTSYHQSTKMKLRYFIAHAKFGSAALDVSPTDPIADIRQEVFDISKLGDHGIGLFDLKAYDVSGFRHSNVDSMSNVLDIAQAKGI